MLRLSEALYDWNFAFDLVRPMAAGTLHLKRFLDLPVQKKSQELALEQLGEAGGCRFLEGKKAG